MPIFTKTYLIIMYFILTLLPLRSQDINTQDNKKINGKASYKMITKLRLLALEQESVLLFTNESSVFVHKQRSEGLYQ